MLNEMFGSFSSGAIGRARFILGTIALAVVAVVLVIALGGGAGVYDRVTGTSGGTPTLSGIALLFLVVVMGAYVVGNLNLVAKRARDIGWSPLLMVILYIIGSGVVWIVLAVVPSQPQKTA